MAIAAMVHSIVAYLFPDAVVWLFGAIMVALLIIIEKHERDDE